MNVWVDRLLTALNNGGLPAMRAFPAGALPEMTAPCAAVRLYRAEKDRTEIMISILAPAALGGAVCEDTAQRAIPLVESLGLKWELKPCEFNNRSDCFCTELLAVYEVEPEVPEEVPEEEEETSYITASISGTALHRATAFTAWRETSPEVVVLEEMPWHFRLEEFFEPGVREEEAPETPFSLKLAQQGYIETYSGCTWIGQKREFLPTGIRYIREGTATSRTTIP